MICAVSSNNFNTTTMNPEIFKKIAFIFVPKNYSIALLLTSITLFRLCFLLNVRNSLSHSQTFPPLRINNVVYPLVAYSVESPFTSWAREVQMTRKDGRRMQVDWVWGFKQIFSGALVGWAQLHFHAFIHAQQTCEIN